MTNATSWNRVFKNLRLNIEKDLVRATVKWLLERGIRPGTYCVSNERGSSVFDQLDLDNFDMVLDLDQFVLRFKHENGTIAGFVLFVFGNDGWDTIADWALPRFWSDSRKKEFESFMDQLADTAMATIEVVRASHFNEPLPMMEDL